MLQIPSKFRSLLRSIQQVFCKYLGYTVTATWDDTVFVHYCLSWHEALEWTKQYRNCVDVVISQYLSTQVIVRFSNDTTL